MRKIINFMGLIFLMMILVQCPEPVPEWRGKEDATVQNFGTYYYISQVNYECVVASSVMCMKYLHCNKYGRPLSETDGTDYYAGGTGTIENPFTIGLMMGYYHDYVDQNTALYNTDNRYWPENVGEGTGFFWNMGMTEEAMNWIMKEKIAKEKYGSSYELPYDEYILVENELITDVGLKARFVYGILLECLVNYKYNYCMSYDTTNDELKYPFPAVISFHNWENATSLNLDGDHCVVAHGIRKPIEDDYFDLDYIKAICVANPNNPKQSERWIEACDLELFEIEAEVIRKSIAF